MSPASQATDWFDKRQKYCTVQRISQLDQKNHTNKEEKLIARLLIPMIMSIFETPIMYTHNKF